MTNEDKKLIADYMEWIWLVEHYITKDNSRFLDRKIHFNLNDAGLCVQEMQKRGEWGAFMNHTWSRWSAQWRDSQASQEFVLHLFNAENFFAAMSQWLKERARNE